MSWGKVFIMLAASAAFALASPAHAAVIDETPTSGSCDGTGRLVCAGADVGASVACETDNAGLATCRWTYGWITTAYSPVGLPGSETHAVAWETTLCSSVSGCTTLDAGNAPSSCSWVGVFSCDESHGFGPLTSTRALAMGECVTLKVTLHAVIDADAAAGGVTLAHAHFVNDGEGAGATCFLDNGR